MDNLVKNKLQLYKFALISILTGYISATVAAETGNCSNLLNHNFPRLQDEKAQDLCQYQGQVVLVVNTASFCGFTKQYKGLEKIYERYREKGFVVLGFPSGNFRNQEYGTNEKIAEFCKNTYGVKFPMFTKSDVVNDNGNEANSLFSKLSDLSEPPRWNFTKYLISRKGEFHKSYSSFTSPTSKGLSSEIEKLLRTN